jgi:pyruvate/2-oxoglutarate dehydrogenase complex dihydrolipoamide acyltransferase (E2) component
MPETNIREVVLADIGEGLTEAHVNQILVKVGQAVRRLDPIVEVETDKATVEITSPWSGKVARILVEEETYVNVGQAVLEIEVESA